MRFASQQKVTGRSWIIVRSGSTVSFEGGKAIPDRSPSLWDSTGSKMFQKELVALEDIRRAAT